MKGKTASEGTSVPPKRPPEVPKGFAGVAAAAAMNIRRQTLVEIMNNCTATVLQQGLHFPGFTGAKCDLSNEQQREKREESRARREKREESREG